MKTFASIAEGTYVCKLSKELQDKARLELNEVPERRASDIEAIRSWMKKQAHLPNKTDDLFILRFLRGAKFSLQTAKEKIDNYFTMRTAIPEWFLNRDPTSKELQNILNKGYFLPFSGYDPYGRKVLFIKTGFDPSTESIDQMIRNAIMILEIICDEEQTQICGYTCIFDYTGFTASAVMTVTPTMIKKAAHCLNNCIPTRIESLHAINLPKVAEVVFNLVISALSEKMRNKIRVHSSIESLYEHVSKEMLPKEYGGTTNMQELAEYWKEQCILYRDAILAEDKFLVDESKRPGKPKTSMNLFGFDGSFRKLEVD